MTRLATLITKDSNNHNELSQPGHNIINASYFVINAELHEPTWKPKYFEVNHWVITNNFKAVKTKKKKKTNKKTRRIKTRVLRQRHLRRLNFVVGYGALSWSEGDVDNHPLRYFTKQRTKRARVLRWAWRQLASRKRATRRWWGYVRASKCSDDY